MDWRLPPYTFRKPKGVKTQDNASIPSAHPFRRGGRSVRHPSLGVTNGNPHQPNYNTKDAPPPSGTARLPYFPASYFALFTSNRSSTRVLQWSPARDPKTKTRHGLHGRRGSHGK